MRSVSLVVPAMGSHLSLISFSPKWMLLHNVVRAISSRPYSREFITVRCAYACVCVCVERTCVRKICPTNVVRIHFSLLCLLSRHSTWRQTLAHRSTATHVRILRMQKPEKKERIKPEKNVKELLCKIAKENENYVKMGYGRCTASQRHRGNRTSKCVCHA